MSSLQEIQDSVAAANDKLVAEQAKLQGLSDGIERIAVLVGDLKAGSVDQAKIDAIATAVASLQSNVDSLNTGLDGLGVKEDAIK